MYVEREGEGLLFGTITLPNIICRVREIFLLICRNTVIKVDFYLHMK